MTRLLSALLCLLLLCPMLGACGARRHSVPPGAIDATAHGVAVTNTGAENSRNLQRLIDALSEEGGTVYLPAGEYEFAENGTQTIGAHCIRMRSHVSIVGDGAATVLKPVGHTAYGLDMFYFNEYLDTGEAVYLEDCRFERFTIDAAGTSLTTYTSAGKGFMFNLFRHCHWQGVTVKHTDATGFGVDCPLDSSMTDCIAVGCGKAAGDGSGGASGFGIGFGYTDGEGLLIRRCQSRGNRKFGFFFEHQGRFNSQKYAPYENHDFRVFDCTSSGNLYNFGGIRAMNVTYTNCHSQAAVRYGFYFEDSAASGARGSSSAGDGESAFAILQTDPHRVTGVYFENSEGRRTPCGVSIVNRGTAPVSDCAVTGCHFSAIGTCTVSTVGEVQGLSLVGNLSDRTENRLSDKTAFRENAKNSWNDAAP